MIRRLLVGGVALLTAVVSVPFSAYALSSDPKQFISADNTFYAYVKGGETISAAFTRVNQDEPFDTVRGDVTVTLDGPDFATKTCVIPKDIAIGKGCQFAPQTATKSGIWRIQFAVPATARSYKEVAPDVRWAKNLFSWNIAINGDGGEQTGRVWTERYAIRQPVASSYLGDFTTHYISEDGYVYRAINRGYNGQISTLSADSIGIRKGTDCVSAYQSVEVSSATLSPALGTCGNAYKLFFEEPSGDLPPKATKWDGTTDWIRPNINRPSIAELHFTSDKSTDQLSGTISFFLRNFIGQYKIKIDVDNDGSFEGQSDVVLNEQMKKLSDGLQQVRFAGVDKDGQVIPVSQQIGIKVEITKVAEIHLVATDVEGRTGGLEVMRLNGDNAPTTKICWNDTELAQLTDATLVTSKIDGRDCPDSIGGVHGWAYADASWGNARYIDDWTYASAKLIGNNQIVYPENGSAAAGTTQRNWLVIGLVALGVVIVVGAAVTVAVLRRKKQQQIQQQVPPQAPTPSGDTTNSGQPIDTDRY
jgi:hypothetical protein